MARVISACLLALPAPQAWAQGPIATPAQGQAQVQAQAQAETRAPEQRLQAQLQTQLPAQSQPAPPPQPTAQSLAAAVDAHYNALRTLRVGFTETYDGLGMHRHEAGTLSLKKPGRMRWEYSEPPGKLFIMDGRYAYSWSPGDAQAQRVPARQLDDLRSPLRLLLGHTRLSREMNSLALAPAPAAGAWKLTGVPRGLENRVQSLELTVTPGGTITAMRLEEVDGSVTTFFFRGEEPNAAVAEAGFRFQPPPGVAVVDGLPPV